MKTSLAAWRTVLTMLEMQVPRPAFDRWVSGAELVHYDPENCVFTVAVQDEDQLNWLQDRLASTIRRLLLGVCNRPADVQFVILPSRE